MQVVVTSPPYWGLRDYDHPGQVGLEPTVDEYVGSLVRVFEQVRRVLHPSGCVWLVLGDGFTSGGRLERAPDRKNRARRMGVRPATPAGLKPKDLVGVPWRVAFALQAAGWWLRGDVVWEKPNTQPESVTDRPTRSHETVFLLTKSERYFYDAGAVTGPNGRRLRSVWSVPTGATGDTVGHPAVFPAGLVDPCVRLSSRPGDLVLDPFMGSGTTGLVAGRLGRRFLGVELHAEYVELARRRLMLAGFTYEPEPG